MKNLLKVAALALVFAAGLTSCESKANTEETTTTEMGTTEMAAPMTTDTTVVTPVDTTAVVAPATTTTTTEQN